MTTTTSALDEYHRQGVITPAEYEILRLRYEADLSTRKAAASLGIHRSSARDRIKNGLRKIAAHLDTEPA